MEAKQENQHNEGNEDNLLISGLIDKLGSLISLIDQLNTGLTSLHIASYAGLTDVVQSFISHGADIESKDNNGNTSLIFASQEGHRDVVQLLISRGADIGSKNNDGNTSLIFASQKGHTDVVQLLLSHGADIESKSNKGSTSLNSASFAGHADVVQLLLSHGADIESKSKKGISALNAASFAGHTDVVQLLISHGADIESRKNNGSTSLNAASNKGHTDVVELLISHLADIESKDNDGDTSVNNGVREGHTDVVRLLINYGADIESKNNREFSPLSSATDAGHIDVVKLLIRRGAHLDYSVLRHAVSRGQTEVVKYVFEELTRKQMRNIEEDKQMLAEAASNRQTELVSYFARSMGNELDQNGLLTALVKAVTSGHFKCVQLLHLLGAKLHLMGDIDLLCCAAKCGSLDIYQYLLIAGLEFKTVCSCSRHARGHLPFSDVIDYQKHEMVLSSKLAAYNTLSFGTSLTAVPTDLLNYPGWGKVECIRNPFVVSRHLNEVITNEIKSIATDVLKYLNFKMEFPYLCGSSAEGTKVGLPDEMDFVFSSRGQILEKNLKDVHHGYRKYVTGFHASSKVFHTYILELFVYILRLNKFNFVSTPPGVGHGSASSPILYRWKENESRNLLVSIDLVPLHHVNGWPHDAIKSSWMMNEETLRSKGYHLVAKPPHPDSEFGKSFEEADRSQLYRVSFTKLEVEHMQNVPNRVKDAYILAKILRNPSVCRMVVKDTDGILHFVDKFLVSYFLKTVFMHNVTAFLHSHRSLIEMTYILYAQLERYLAKRFIPLFWMPGINLLEGLSLDAAKCHQVAVEMKSFVCGLLMQSDDDENVTGDDSVGEDVEDAGVEETVVIYSRVPHCSGCRVYELNMDRNVKYD